MTKFATDHATHAAGIIETQGILHGHLYWEEGDEGPRPMRFYTSQRLARTAAEAAIQKLEAPRVGDKLHEEEKASIFRAAMRSTEGWIRCLQGDAPCCHVTGAGGIQDYTEDLVEDAVTMHLSHR